MTLGGKMDAHSTVHHRGPVRRAEAVGDGGQQLSRLGDGERYIVFAERGAGPRFWWEVRMYCDV